MNAKNLKRWGAILDTLAEMCDLERQLVTQSDRPAEFVPDELLERWFNVFQGGRGLIRTDLSEDILTCLVDFDLQLAQIIDALPDNADDKEDYILNDEVWQAVREMADWTLTRVALLSQPDEPVYSVN